VLNAPSQAQPPAFDSQGVNWIDSTAIVLAHYPSYLKGQSEPAMGENAWFVWNLFVALMRMV
jgi:hypothetical protein